MILSVEPAGISCARKYLIVITMAEVGTDVLVAMRAPEVIK